ncbi:hypothetical protein BDZ90DRAFT_251794 [Jaminaea rosea]|uniref:TFIIE beta domain-containing protein n=1 Tax=Jaminaea rosea TaxID=1569628 RepID=A0A316UYC3_9BASI|nr:hypothetical protein BDZ90DRAFT_251794 [Jaminaea rosea]PWN28145.1 hypothetical protein BDZ90DRAFT_251794 [Jaminaea rosea]
MPPTSSSSSLAPGQIYSQPALTGAGTHQSTILITALDALKACRVPVRFEDFAITNGLTALLDDEKLKERFKAHPRVVWNERLDLWSYKPEHDVRSPNDLLSLLHNKYTSSTTRCAGMKLSELRESYPQAREAIEAFAATRPRYKREVLVLRGKDGAIKMVFSNESKGEEMRGPDDGGDEELLFRSLWSSIKVPDSAVDLARQLEAEGMTSANLVQSTVSANPSGPAAGGPGGRRGGRGGKRGGGGSGRRGKDSNTHLKGVVDLTKDYVGEE